MPERISKAQRSKVMAAIKSRDTAPELLVRKLIRQMGWRYRLHRRDLPGTPDITLGPTRKIINVHGCFWHVHRCRHGKRAPIRNRVYWQAKRARNAARDVRVNRQLRRAGWRVLTIWECQLRDRDKLASRLVEFLGAAPCTVKAAHENPKLRPAKQRKRKKSAGPPLLE